MQIIFENIQTKITDYPLLASATDKDGYTMAIYDYVDNQYEGYQEGDTNIMGYPLKRNGRKVIFNPQKQYVLAGYWMDFPEREWNIKNKKQYFNIPREKRAQMECEHCLYSYKPLKVEFESRR